jgi:predicted secreted protein
VAGQATAVSFMGIGKWNGTANFSNTTATPIEVTFNNGQHGINLNASAAPVWSDWINVSSLTLGIGDKVVVCLDEGATSGYRTSFNNTNANAAYSSLPTYNDATSDNADSGNWVFGISAIQTLGGPGDGGPPTGGQGIQTVLNADNATYNFTSNGAPPAGCGRAIPYWAYDSVWNKGTLVRGTNFTETITCYADSFPNYTSISWNWPNTIPTNNTYSYPNIAYGQVGTGIAAGASAPVTNITPSTINNITTLSLIHNVSLAGTTTEFDVHYFGTLTQTPGATDQVQFDLHVHAPQYVRDALTALSTKYSFTDSQSTVWYIINNPAPTPHKIVFIRQDMGDLLNYTVDLKTLFLQAKANGLITGSEYFNGLALGVEPRTVSGTLSITSLSVSYAFTAGASTIFTPSVALNADSANNNLSIRETVTLSGPSQGYIRIRMTPATSTWQSDFQHISVGKWNGTANLSSTTATPIEVTFGSGGHGLNMAVGSADVWSDWINITSLTLNTGDKLVVILDTGAVGGYRQSDGNTNCNTGVGSVPGYTVATAPNADVGVYATGIAEIQTASSPQ